MKMLKNWQTRWAERKLCRILEGKMTDQNAICKTIERNMKRIDEGIAAALYFKVDTRFHPERDEIQEKLRCKITSPQAGYYILHLATKENRWPEPWKITDEERLYFAGNLVGEKPNFRLPLGNEEIGLASKFYLNAVDEYKREHPHPDIDWIAFLWKQ